MPLFTEWCCETGGGREKAGEGTNVALVEEDKSASAGAIATVAREQHTTVAMFGLKLCVCVWVQTTVAKAAQAKSIGWTIDWERK